MSDRQHWTSSLHLRGGYIWFSHLQIFNLWLDHQKLTLCPQLLPRKFDTIMNIWKVFTYFYCDDMIFYVFPLLAGSEHVGNRKKCHRNEKDTRVGKSRFTVVSIQNIRVNKAIVIIITCLFPYKQLQTYFCLPLYYIFKMINSLFKKKFLIFFITHHPQYSTRQRVKSAPGYSEHIHTEY